MSGHSPQGPGHSEDFHFRPVLVLIPISMIILVVYVITVGVWSTSALSGEMRKKQAEGAEPMRAQLIALHAHEDSALTEYRWIDKEKGIVQLPIDRAMELLLQESAHQADSTQATVKPNPTVKPKKK